MEIARVSTRSHSVENSLWKRLWTCRKTQCEMNESFPAVGPVLRPCLIYLKFTLFWSLYLHLYNYRLSVCEFAIYIPTATVSSIHLNLVVFSILAHKQ